MELIFLFHPLFSALLFSAALCADTFGAGLILGSRKIVLPLPSLLSLSLVCSVSLTLSMLAGELLGDHMTASFASVLGAVLLIGLGCVRLFEGALKKLLSRLCAKTQGYTLRFSGLTIFLKVCLDSSQADFNRSNSISLWEAASLAAALRLDGVAAGLGAGMMGANPCHMGFLSLILNFGAAKGGCALGEKFSQHSRRDFGFAAGFLLILLGTAKLL